MGKFITFLISAWLVFSGYALVAEEPAAKLPADLVSATIGIRLCRGDDCRPARKTEEVSTEHQFQIYTIPVSSAPGYVYVVYADPETTVQLNTPEQIIVPKNKVLILPSAEEPYQFDQNTTTATITVICSDAPLPELETLLKNSLCSPDEWAKVEETLIAQSHISLETIPEKPFSMAAPTRNVILGTRLSKVEEEFLKCLKISSGKGLVVKKYAFSLQE